MDDRDLILNDRENRLRLAIESLKRRTPPGEQPPDAVVPTWDGRGGVICPKCGGTCRTPVAWNPYTGTDEKMILVGGKASECPHEDCDAVHFMTEALAQVHNHYHFPDDPQYLPRREPRKKKRRDG